MSIKLGFAFHMIDNHSAMRTIHLFQVIRCMQISAFSWQTNALLPTFYTIEIMNHDLLPFHEVISPSFPLIHYRSSTVIP